MVTSKTRRTVAAINEMAEYSAYGCGWQLFRVPCCEFQPNVVVTSRRYMQLVLVDDRTVHGSTQ